MGRDVNRRVALTLRQPGLGICSLCASLPNWDSASWDTLSCRIFSLSSFGMKRVPGTCEEIEFGPIINRVKY
jgi:hypothetical protein